jgi:T-complex protein 1 subunit theta
MLVLKIMSKFELKRIAKSVGASAIVKLGTPTPEEIGTANEVAVREISSTKVTVFRKDEDENKLATIVLRGSTNSQLDDIERFCDVIIRTCLHRCLCLFDIPLTSHHENTQRVCLRSNLCEGF